ncbi:ATP-binding protein [Luteimonas sp. SX5]|uniref:histidine kinase n=1 Tax=Luteimonas galliterrae TaxID=2940486 RepID=A0ABT0MLU1_9GAMM|nr:ATP-binding protein [Luteimonas galliterrae]MCL1635853.1 ATP-binding protein [Luteimonas galliterrae]
MHYIGAMPSDASVPPSLDRLTTPLVWADASGRIGGSNAAFARWLGISVRRLVDQPLAALELDGDALRRALSAATSADAEPLRLRRIELAYLGGEPRFADAWLTRGEDGGWLLEAHPVDEFPGDDPAIALPGALSAALKGLAHELRNPLAGLKGAAQLLARRSQDAAGHFDDNSRELTGLIESEVERLTQLLDRLLSPMPAAPHAPLNIHATLERVLRLAETDAGWAVRLVRDYDPSLPELSGDADRLTQATWNLVRNAIEAGAANITLRTRAEHGVRIGDALQALALRMEIIDDGRGVPEDLTERLFLPLVSGRADGSGLGLALAQQIAREHRGSLTYRSRPGHTVFTLLLPMPADEARADG